MKTSDRQFMFLQNVAELILYCTLRGIKITGGELHRTQYQHDENVRTNLSNARRSKHQDRLAIDLNLWHEGKVMWAMSDEKTREMFQHVGDFWESLAAGNKWGGNWTDPFDPAHFEAA